MTEGRPLEKRKVRKIFDPPPHPLPLFKLARNLRGLETQPPLRDRGRLSRVQAWPPPSFPLIQAGSVLRLLSVLVPRSSLSNGSGPKSISIPTERRPRLPLWDNHRPSFHARLPLLNTFGFYADSLLADRSVCRPSRESRHGSNRTKLIEREREIRWEVSRLEEDGMLFCDIIST